jgi:hypothetical protein
MNVVYALAINATGHVFAGGSGGVFRSMDNGGRWAATNSGLTDADVRSLAVNAKGYIFTGAVNGLVFRSVQPTTPVREIGAERPADFSLEQNYPNPFNASTTIRFYLPVAGVAALKIFDVRGNEVATLINGKKSAGEHRLVFDASGIANGVYFYRLEVSGAPLYAGRKFIEGKKMLLIK